MGVERWTLLMGMDRRGTSVRCRMTGRRQLRRISATSPGDHSPLGFGPVSMVCNSFIVDIS